MMSLLVKIVKSKMIGVVVLLTMKKIRITILMAHLNTRMRSKMKQLSDGAEGDIEQAPIYRR